MSELHSDNAKELTLGEFGKVLKQDYVRATEIEPYSPWQNRAEMSIKEMKKSTLQVMRRRHAPRRLWDFAAVYATELFSITAHPLPALRGRTPMEHVSGNTPDISEYFLFDFYEPLWSLDVSQLPEEKRVMGRWLGVVH